MTCFLISSNVHNSRSFLEGQHIEEEPKHLMIKVKNFILNLNFFDNSEEETVWHLHNQRLATRVFLVLMAVALSSLILFTLLSHRTQTVIVKQPSINAYIQLETQIQSDTLICPCQSIANQYKYFISFQPTFHQICSSFFLTQEWLAYLWSNTATSASDFRVSGYALFPTLKLLCNLSLETITNELLNFNSTKYATNTIKRRDLFQSEVREIVNLFEQTTRNSFLSQVAIFRQIMSGNGLLSGWLTGNYYELLNSTDSLNLVMIPMFYTTDVNDSNTTCSCHFNPDTCDKPSAIYNFSQGQVGYACFSDSVKL